MPQFNISDRSDRIGSVFSSEVKGHVRVVVETVEEPLTDEEMAQVTSAAKFAVIKCLRARQLGKP